MVTKEKSLYSVIIKRKDLAVHPKKDIKYHDMAVTPSFMHSGIMLILYLCLTSYRSQSP